MNHPLMGDTAWSWFADPRAVRIGDTTFVGYVTRQGHVEVAAIERGSATVHRVHDRLDKDDHASPALLVRPDGRIAVFYSAHDGPAMLHRVWDPFANELGPVQEIGTHLTGPRGHTYPQPVVVNDRVSLYWRGPAWNAVVATSDDGGDTWSTPRALFISRGRPYLKVASRGSTVHLAYTEGHPHRRPRNRIWYLAERSGGLFHADGSPAGGSPPLQPRAGDLVHDPDGLGASWVWDVACAPNGQPVIAFASVADRDTHRYHYAVFDGEWVVHDLGDGGGSIQGDEEWAYSAGLALDHESPDTVYLIRRSRSRSQLERMTLAGGSWTRTVLARGEPGTKDLRPCVVRGPGPGPAVLWLRGRYDHYRDFDLSLMGWPG